MFSFVIMSRKARARREITGLIGKKEERGRAEGGWRGGWEAKW